MHVSKSYSLLRFLNRRHTFLMRALFATGTWFLVGICTFKLGLAGRVAGILWADDFKSGLRLAHWFLRRSWIGIDVVDDPYFDFTSWLTAAQLDQLEVFLDMRNHHTSPFEDATDRLYVLAARAHQALEHKDIASFRNYQTRFEDLAAKAIELGRQSASVQTRKDKPNTFSTQDANAALHDFASLARSMELEWYVISGTFLGIVREGGWLPHDYDIDVGAHAENIDLDRIRAGIAGNLNLILRKEDWQVRIVERNGETTLERVPALLKLVHRTGINIDLFIHHLEHGIRWHGSNIHRWDNMEFTLAQYQLAGLTVLGPTNSDRYLTENYGDWRTPVTDFSSTTGTPNMVPVENYVSKALFLKRRVKFPL